MGSHWQISDITGQTNRSIIYDHEPYFIFDNLTQSVQVGTYLSRYMTLELQTMPLGKHQILVRYNQRSQHRSLIATALFKLFTRSLLSAKIKMLTVIKTYTRKRSFYECEVRIQIFVPLQQFSALLKKIDLSYLHLYLGKGGCTYV